MLIPALLIAATVATSPVARSTNLDARGEPHAGRAWAPVVARDSLRIAAALARAERYATAGRIADARREYRDAIDEQAAAGESTAQTHWLLATAYYAEGRDLSAARALDDAARAAAEFGDPAMELRATFEAAVLYARQRMPDLVAARVDRTRRLLKSPAVPAELRESIARRMVTR